MRYQGYDDARKDGWSVVDSKEYMGNRYFDSSVHVSHKEYGGRVFRYKHLGTVDLEVHQGIIEWMGKQKEHSEKVLR